MNIMIRPANKEDYPALVAIGRSATADYVQSVADLEFGDQTRPPGMIAHKLIAETPDHQPVGVATYGQSAPAADPQRFNVWFFVPPHLQGQGIGQALYERVMAELMPHQPRCLETGVRSDLPRAVRFLEDRGFITVNSECETHLDLTIFDPDRFEADRQRVAQQSIIVKTLAELSNDPARDTKLYELHQHRQLVGMEAGTLPPFAEWRARFWQIPRLLPAGFCVALADGEYIGQSNALAAGVPGEVEYGYTGVLPAYRNRGIARAMKLHVLRWAKAQGYTVVRSWSDSHNAAMIRVNWQLGFVVQPPVLWLHKMIV